MPPKGKSSDKASVASGSPARGKKGADAKFARPPKNSKPDFAFGLSRKMTPQKDKKQQN